MTEKDKMVKVYFTWSQSTIDPVQYKPLAPTFLPESIKIMVEIPNEERYVVSFGEGATILTPDGMAYASKVFANAIAKTYREN
jgi:hypothetical protein